MIPTRASTQFEDRWYKRLDPDRKFEWTKEEEWIIFLKIRDIKRQEDENSSDSEDDATSSDLSSDSLFDEVLEEDQENKNQLAGLTLKNWVEIVKLIDYRSIDAIKRHWTAVMPNKLPDMNFSLG